MPEIVQEEAISSPPVKLTEGQTWTRFAQKQISRLRHDWRQGDLRNWWGWFNQEQETEALAMSMPADWPIDRIGRNPLMAAVLLNKITHLNVLVSSKPEVNLNEKDASGHAPLHYAAGLHFPDMTHRLLDLGADEVVRNPGHKTPAKLAFITGDETLASELGESTESLGIHAQTATSGWVKSKPNKHKKNKVQSTMPWLVEEEKPRELSEDEDSIGLYRDDAHLSPHQKGKGSKLKKSQHFVADFSARERQVGASKIRVPYEGKEELQSAQKTNPEIQSAAWSAETGQSLPLNDIRQVAIVYKKRRTVSK